MMNFLQYGSLQVSQHHISLSQNLARLMGWQILSYNGCSGVGEMEDFATASSIQLVAPNNDRYTNNAMSYFYNKMVKLPIDLCRLIHCLE